MSKVMNYVNNCSVNNCRPCGHCKHFKIHKNLDPKSQRCKKLNIPVKMGEKRDCKHFKEE